MDDTSDVQFLSRGETRLTCPDCGGALAEIALPQITYYRCHVGHQFGPQSLAAAQADTAGDKLWAAVATLEETAALARHLSGRTAPSEDAGHQASTAKLAESLRGHIQNTPRR
jgi:two-component system chemotaxis response regulator CheB